MNFSAKIRKLVADRTAQTLLIAALILAYGGWQVREPLRSEEDHLFWFEKLGWRDNTDVVLLGDSRIHMGLSPGDMAEDLRGLRVKNFGFSSVAYSNDYLSAAERVWDSRSTRKVAVLGITPQSLRQRGTDNQFSRSTRDLTIVNYWKARWLGWVQQRWPPLSRRLMEQIVVGKTQPYFQTRHHADGWVEPVTENVVVEQQIAADRQNRKFPVSDELIGGVLAKVRDWTARGIHVYGIRPPTCAAMEAVEDDFDVRKFVADFESAGGYWITPSIQNLHSFDGSHLDAASAHLLSVRVARTIATSLSAPADRMAQESERNAH